VREPLSLLLLLSAHEIKDLARVEQEALPEYIRGALLLQEGVAEDLPLIPGEGVGRRVLQQRLEVALEHLLLFREELKHLLILSAALILFQELELVFVGPGLGQRLEQLAPALDRVLE